MITGYAVLYNVPSKHGLDGTPFGEIVAPGAFRRSVSQAKRGEWNISALVNHDWRRPLGDTARGSLRLQSDKRGVRFELDATLPDDFTGVSFSFQATQWKHRTELTYELIEGSLIEISLLRGVKPAYPQTLATVRVRDLEAEITEMKARGYGRNRREARRAR